VQSILGFLIILGPLVVVHELGHFLFAKLFGVRPEVFSIGFGPKIIGKQIGETEWRIAAIPLGGYVKLLGDDPEQNLSPEEKHRALPNQEPYKRFWIFFAGPFFNFLFAVLVFACILVIGEPQVANVAGRIVKGSDAEAAGLRTGDRILEIGGEATRTFQDVFLAIHEHPDQQLNFKIQRPRTPEPFDLQIRTKSEEGYSLYGEEKKVGKVFGLLPQPRGLMVGVADQSSIAGQAGIETGDEVVKVAGETVKSWEDVESLYDRAPKGTSIAITFKEKAGSEVTKEWIKSQTSKDMASDWGLDSSELFVSETITDEKTGQAYPAAVAGIAPGDRLLSVNQEPIYSFVELRRKIQTQGKEKGHVVVSWIRNGKTLEAELKPVVLSEKDAALNEQKEFLIGVKNYFSAGEPEMVTEQIFNPFILVYKSVSKMGLFIYRNVVVLSKMVQGDVSTKTLGGPVMIGQIAGESLERGLVAFLNTMAILSVGLGFVNILPIPVLDGGHLLLLLVEMVRRRPLTVRQMEVIQQIGLSMILLLMAIVLRNDFMRLPFFQ